MDEIRINRPSEDGLTMYVYIFSIMPYTFNLVYTAHWVYNRDKDGLFSYADHKFNTRLIYKKWCEDNHLFYDEDGEYHEDWYEYVKSMNPVCNKTKDGRTLSFGISAEIAHLPKCPKDVAEEALELARKKLVVKYE